MTEMVSAMSKYETYKDSGVDWIGVIPKGWNIKPGLTVFSENKRNNKGMKEDQVLSLSYGNIIVKPPEKLVGLVPESFETYQLVEPGDIIIRCTDLQNDKTSLRTGLAKDKGIITSAYINLNVKKDQSSKYWHYYLHSLDTTKVIYKFGSGLRQNLSYTDFKRLPIFDIEPQIQTAIATFLDRKTLQIDQAIAIKEKQIDLLKERKKILIQNAVTRGLDPNVLMKDSDVEWTREMPEHWEVKKIKFIVKFIGGGTPSKERQDFWGGDICWVSPKDMKMKFISNSIDKITGKAVEKSSVKILPENTVLIVVRGMILAKKIPIAITKKTLTINQDMKGLVVSASCSPVYLLHMLDGLHEELSALLEESGHGTKTLPTEKLGGFEILLPPICEQKRIINYIEDKSSKLDAGISMQQQQIDKLKEYNSTLINSAVTGKIKVA